MTTKRTPPAKKQDVFTVRIPVDIAQVADGTIVVKSYQVVSHQSDRGDNVQMSADEYAAFRDVMLDHTIQWTAANAEKLHWFSVSGGTECHQYISAERGLTPADNLPSTPNIKRRFWR